MLIFILTNSLLYRNTPTAPTAFTFYPPIEIHVNLYVETDPTNPDLSHSNLLLIPYQYYYPPDNYIPHGAF